MSIESAKSLYSRITTDTEFRNRLEQAATEEERQQILQAGGYEFTSEEWEATKGELSNSELESVSGGDIDKADVGIGIGAVGLAVGLGSLATNIVDLVKNNNADQNAPPPALAVGGASLGINVADLVRDQNAP